MGTFPRVTHPSATHPEGCVRLACVKPAASVRSEPGSNSHVGEDRSVPLTELTEVKHQDHASQRTPMSFLKSQHEPDFSLLHNQAPKGTQTQGPRRPRFPSSIYQTCQRAADAKTPMQTTRPQQSQQGPPLPGHPLRHTNQKVNSASMKPI